MKANLQAQLDEAKRMLLARVPQMPRIAIVLGSGLSDLLSELQIETEIPFGEIPHVHAATVEGHRGKMVFGKLGGVRVVCLQGRLHFYELGDMEAVVFPFRALAWSGVDLFFLTNASGGVHADWLPPKLVAITDHINFMGSNPLMGTNDAQIGVRFPDLTGLYDPQMRKTLQTIAREESIELLEGVYVAIHGPSYETPAEISMYTKLGGDLVGMSTVPEAIAVRHMGKKVVAVSCMTNQAAGVTKLPLLHQEVLENASKAYVQFAKLIKGFVQTVGSERA